MTLAGRDGTGAAARHSCNPLVEANSVCVSMPYNIFIINLFCNEMLAMLYYIMTWGRYYRQSEWVTEWMNGCWVYILNKDNQYEYEE